MDAKQILFNSEARSKLKTGIDKLCDSVKITLGPGGRNVIISKKYGSPQISKDGVTVAREIFLEDPIENMGAQLVKEVASKTADVAGDGTTTATLLAQQIIQHGIKNVTAGANPIDLKRGIDLAVKEVVKYLKEIAEKVGDSNEKIKQVATVSANNDMIIGEMIADAMKKVSNDGIITIEEAKGIETYVEVVEGMQFDKGYISPYFVTDTEKMITEYENPLILIYDGKISTMNEFLPVLEKVAQSGQALVVICEDIDGEALATMVVNRIRGGLKVVGVKAPGYGDRRKAMMEDLSILVGAQYVSTDFGIKLEGVELADLGNCDRIIINKESTTIIGGSGDKDNIKKRINQIRKGIEEATSDYDKEKLQERLAKLSGGVAVIYVGAASEVEMKEKKDRFDDALHATEAAVEEGIIPGGGVSYIRAISKLENLIGENQDQNTGVDIVRKALVEPLKQIASNSGLVDGSVVVFKVSELDDDMGYNARTKQYENLKESGVIDPVKVARVALENAASVAGMFLTTECVISEIENKEDPPMPQGGMY